MLTMSYGGGKQTVAIITLILQGKLPKPDLIVMADTSYEVKTTFEYLNQVVQPALKGIGLQVEIAGHDLATVDLYRNDDLLLPAFTRQNGTVGKMPTLCSVEWKQRVIRRWLRNQGVKDTDVWLGISLDEAERMKPSGLKWYRHIYPLIEILPMHRSQCVNQILSYGWKVPHKSRCAFCSNQSLLAWKQLKDLENGDFDLALAVDAKIRAKDPNVYLHPSGLPLGEGVEQTERQSDMFDGCDGGYCLT